MNPVAGVWYVHPEEDVWYLYSPSYPDSKYPF